MHPAFETISSPSNAPAAGAVNLFRPDQIATRATWHHIPDRASYLGALHAIDQTRRGATTVTVVNPLDPGTVDDVPQGEHIGWLVPTGAVTIPPAYGARQ